MFLRRPSEAERCKNLPSFGPVSRPPRDESSRPATRHQSAHRPTLSFLVSSRSLLQSPILRRRVTAGLNKGKARNALARAVFFNRLGEMRDRSYEDHRCTGPAASTSSAPPYHPHRPLPAHRQRPRRHQAGRHSLREPLRPRPRRGALRAGPSQRGLRLLLGAEWHAPSVFWYVGGLYPDAYEKAKQAGRVAQYITTNRSPNFAPSIHPTLETGVEAMVVAARAWLSS